MYLEDVLDGEKFGRPARSRNDEDGGDYGDDVHTDEDSDGEGDE